MDKKQNDSELFTGEVEKLDSKDTIEMTVSQVLSAGYSASGDEFFAEVTNEVAGDKGILLPAGTIAHGKIKEVAQAKRMGRDGWIEMSFDYLITPDGREIPIKGKVSTKLHPVVGVAKNVATSTGYTLAGGLVGGYLALNVLGLEAAVASNGYTVAGGAGVGAAVGLGIALWRKGKDALISPGDEIKVKVGTSIKLPVMSEKALKQEEIAYDGLNVRITNYELQKDPFGELNTITLHMSVQNLTQKNFSSFDIALMNEAGKMFYPSVFEDSSLMFAKIQSGDRVAGNISFAVDNPKKSHWLIFIDRYKQKPLAKISLDNVKRQIAKEKKEKKRG